MQNDIINITGKKLLKADADILVKWIERMGVEIMNSEIKKQLVSSELRRKFTEELKIRTKGLIGRPVNEKSKNEFTKMVKKTKEEE